MGNSVVSSGIEPEPRASETPILSIVLRDLFEVRSMRAELRSADEWLLSIQLRKADLFLVQKLFQKSILTNNNQSFRSKLITNN